jgi:hypothetical protein
MTQVELIQKEIEALSSNDFARLREWFVEQDWRLWDQQLEGDVAAGKLEFLRDEAMRAKANGELRDL